MEKSNIEIFLKSYCDINGFTQTEIAKKTGIPLTTIKSYFNSKFNPTPVNIKKIEKGLNVDIDFLFEYPAIFNLNNRKGVNKALEYIYNYTNKHEYTIETEETFLNIINKFDFELFIEKSKKENTNKLNGLDDDSTKILNLLNLLNCEISKSSLEKLKNYKNNYLQNSNTKSELIEISINNEKINIQSETVLKIILSLQSGMRDTFYNLLKSLATPTDK